MVIAVLGPVWDWSGVLASVVVGEFTVVVGEFTVVVGEFTIVVGEFTVVVGEFTKVIGAGVVTSVTNMVWFVTVLRRKIVSNLLIFASIIEHHVSYSASC